MNRRIWMVLLLLSIFLVACDEPKNEVVQSMPAPVKEVHQQEKKWTQEITISAIGDILIHSPVYKDAWKGDRYDFVPMFAPVEHLLDQSTITVANQETMIGGTEIGLSSYPSFNSPREVGDALKEIGVNVVTIANNHTLDKGEKAIQRAIEHWETIDMMYTGAYKDQEDREKLRILGTDEGISVAFLSYTYGTNGIPVPEGKDFLVNLIDKASMKQEIKRAKELADVVILSLHFGNEYERLPSESQKELVQFAVDQGVHAVIGHHPHVLQPIEWVTGKDGNRAIVAYSLGNFLSNQQKLYQRIGGILNFTVKKTTASDEVEVQVHSPTFIPTYVTFQANWSDYKIKPMYELTDHDLENAASHYEEIKSHLSQWMPELGFPEESSS